MTDACVAVVEAGAVSCVVADARGAIVAGVARRGTEDLPRLLATASSDGAPEECLVVGPELSWFLAFVRGVAGHVVVLVVPTTTSVALGWSLLHRVVGDVEARS